MNLFYAELYLMLRSKTNKSDAGCHVSQCSIEKVFNLPFLMGETVVMAPWMVALGESSLISLSWLMSLFLDFVSILIECLVRSNSDMRLKTVVLLVEDHNIHDRNYDVQKVCRQ